MSSEQPAGSALVRVSSPPVHFVRRRRLATRSVESARPAIRRIPTRPTPSPSPFFFFSVESTRSRRRSAFAPAFVSFPLAFLSRTVYGPAPARPSACIDCHLSVWFRAGEIISNRSSYYYYYYCVLRHIIIIMITIIIRSCC